MKTLLMDGHKIRLTDQEVEIFAALFNARGKVLTTKQIGLRILTDADNPDVLVRKRVWDLRKKLHVTDFRIIAQQWVGYWLSRLPGVIHVESSRKGAARAA